jgi:leucyl aminopeptidase
MVNFNKKDPGSIYINRDIHSSKTLNAFVDKLITTYLQSTPKSFSCGYACSDHASWTAKNFLAAFASESGLDDMMPLLHTTQDTHSQSNSRSDIAVNFGKLGLAFIMELGLE